MNIIKEYTDYTCDLKVKLLNILNEWETVLQKIEPIIYYKNKDFTTVDLYITYQIKKDKETNSIIAKRIKITYDITLPFRFIKNNTIFNESLKWIKSRGGK